MSSKNNNKSISSTLPQIGVRYWHIRTDMVSHNFIVKECIWEGYMADYLRLAKNNVFLNEYDAMKKSISLNENLKRILKAANDSK